MSFVKIDVMAELLGWTTLDQVYLIKWPRSLYVCMLFYMYIYIDIKETNFMEN